MRHFLLSALSALLLAGCAPTGGLFWCDNGNYFSFSPAGQLHGTIVLGGVSFHSTRLKEGQHFHIGEDSVELAHLQNVIIWDEKTRQSTLGTTRYIHAFNRRTQTLTLMDEIYAGTWPEDEAPFSEPEHYACAKASRLVYAYYFIRALSTI